MRRELDILRDIAVISKHLLARYPFDSPESLAFHWQNLGLLHSELYAYQDRGANQP